MAGVGDALFRAHGDYEARRQWVKRIFVGYDNDATLEGWAHSTQGNHEGRTMGGVKPWVGVTAASPGWGSNLANTGVRKRRARGGCGITRGKSSAST